MKRIELLEKLDLSCFVAFDFETTGLDPYGDKIIEIAAIRFQDGVITDRFVHLLNPERNIKCSMIVHTLGNPANMSKIMEIADLLDVKIIEMINTDRPVIFDCLVDKVENCFPMIPSGKPHNQMLLGPKDQKEKKITGKGKTLV